MKDDKISRRTFIRNTSLTAAGAIVGALSSRSQGLSASTESAIRKTPSYNPDMEYRRLGKTGLWVSVVCLGGHWKRVNVMKQDFDKNRREVVSRCIDVGINHIDAC
ncbi:MAG: twin-arginine translocation signal domain-containing protein, partial [Sedimentisphaerales bacterium]